MTGARPRTTGILLAAALLLPAAAAAAPAVDLTAAQIVIRPGDVDGERVAAEVLAEEVEARTGLALSMTTTWPAEGPVIALAAGAGTRAWDRELPDRAGAALEPEGYRLLAEARDGRPVVWVLGADRLGTLYGVGGLLRALDWASGSARLPALDVSTAPRDPIRGHQLGYRHHSNTYDGWDASHYDQYIRELALFGANAIEGIPFHDTRSSPLMPLPRDEMNRVISEICARYGLQYWLWTPADFDLDDAAARGAALERLERLFADVPRLDAIFVPGGDPGNNPAELVLPYLEEIAGRLSAHHPDGRVWLSLQHFDAAEVDAVFAWIDRDGPGWLGGLVAGPGSYPIAETRARLDPRYRLRDYPDITHTVRCQYPVPWWDPAFNLTLGREPINPRPTFYARIHDRLSPHTDGFISYSDGVNDDVNKILWTRKAWDPDVDVRNVLIEYARVFFNGRVAERAADGILALERNWHGPLATNGSVDATLLLWQQLAAEAPELEESWRWQMALLRAYYDAYTRHRLLYETALEAEASRLLAEAREVGAEAAMSRAMAVLARAETEGCCRDWRRRIEELCDALFAAIRMQTSVPKHHASGPERGAVLDFVDHPLNNRWWLEDEFARVRALPDEAARLARLEVLRTWADPGPGSYYDDVGNVAASPRVRRGDSLSGDRLRPGDPIPHFTWEGGPSRQRLSWLTSLRWPTAIVYEHLDPEGSYLLRLSGPGTARPRADGEALEPVRDGREPGDLKEYRVPAALVRDGRLVITFDQIDERHLNWRQHSRLAEAWLIRQ